MRKRGNNRIRQILKQQQAMAAFGSYALKINNLQAVLAEAARLCAEGLQVPFCKICRYRPEFEDLIIETGHGWKNGVVGTVVSSIKDNSPQGKTFMTKQPAICHNLNLTNEFILPKFYKDHNIISTIDVPIEGKGDIPYGVLEVDSNFLHNYVESDINFLIGYANVLSAAIGRLERVVQLDITVNEMKQLVEEKNKLIEQKDVLAQELQHRVRNNLQLIYGMLEKQVVDTIDRNSKRGLTAIARRVTTLAQVYDHLLGSGISRITDFGSYAKALCSSLKDIQTVEVGGITLTCKSEPVLLDLDTVTALGIMIAELVTNSYDHAFPDGKGNIAVNIRINCVNRQGILTVKDDGIGFKADPNTTRHGLGLVTRLLDQVEGTLSVVSNNGTTWTIVFPINIS